MEVRQAWNEVASGTLYVGTYATTPGRRGVPTTWRIANLNNPDDVFVICDGEPFDRFTVLIGLPPGSPARDRFVPREARAHT